MMDIFYAVALTCPTFETDNILCTKKLSQPVSSATQHLSTGEFGEELVTLRYRKFAL